MARWLVRGDLAVEVEAEDAFDVDRIMAEAFHSRGVPEALRQSGAVVRVTYEATKAEDQAV